MKLSTFIEGLKILQPYFKKDGYHIGAEHDHFYVYETDEPLTQEDIAKMIKLGWFQEEGISGYGGEYNLHESWSAYV